MESPDEGQQEPGAYQLAVSHVPQVPGGPQEMPQDALDTIPHDGGLQQPGGSQLAVPDGPQVPGRGQEMPEHFRIGTKKAFEENYAYHYEKRQIGLEIIYVCTKGSKWSRKNELLVLRYEAGTWTAYDSDVSANGRTLHCRQPVFQCLDTDITKPGWHQWQTNDAASRNADGLTVDWRGALRAETKVP